MNCTKCTKPFGATGETIRCNGFCNGTVHADCSGLDRSAITLCKNKPNVLWFCDQCLDILNKRSFEVKNGKASSTTSSELSQDSTTSMFSKLQSEITDNRKLILSLIDKLTKLVVTPSSLSIHESAWRAISGSPASSRKRKAEEELVFSNDEVHGTKTNATFKVKILKPKCYIHLSQFDPSATEDEIAELVEGCLKTTGAEITKLVPKGRELSQLKFISFKVGIDAGLSNLALTRSTWPVGVTARPFQNRPRSQNFFRPGAYGTSVTVNQEVISDDQSTTSNLSVQPSPSL